MPPSAFETMELFLFASVSHPHPLVSELGCIVWRFLVRNADIQWQEWSIYSITETMKVCRSKRAATMLGSCLRAILSATDQDILVSVFFFLFEKKREGLGGQD